MLPKCLLFIFKTPFIRRNVWPVQLAHFGFLASLFGHPLCEWLSSQIRHFCFDLQFFAEWPKTLAVEALRDRNWLMKFLHLVNYACYITHQVLGKKRFGFVRVTNFMLKNWKDPAVFFAF